MKTVTDGSSKPSETQIESITANNNISHTNYNDGIIKANNNNEHKTNKGNNYNVHKIIGDNNNN